VTSYEIEVKKRIKEESIEFKSEQWLLGLQTCYYKLPLAKKDLSTIQRLVGMHCTASLNLYWLQRFKGTWTKFVHVYNFMIFYMIDAIICFRSYSLNNLGIFWFALIKDIGVAKKSLQTAGLKYY
jgi:hypothetical protein